jgi:hypothetical protein
MTWVPDDYAKDLEGLDLSLYVFVKCLVCQSVYRWGIYGFREGAVHCPICGATTWNPTLVDKTTYLRYLQRMGSIKNSVEKQKRLWDFRRQEEEYGRR